MKKRKQSQTRNLKVSNLRAKDETADKVIAARFIVFGVETELWPGVFEEIAPTCLDNADLSDVRALADHDTATVLGRTKVGTLSLSVGSEGVSGEIKINENDSDAMNLYSRVQRGDIDQCSFGFNILKESHEEREDGTVKFTIEEIELLEVSVVTFPAYEDTAAEARSKQIEDMKQRKIIAKKANIKEKLNGIKTTYFE